MGQAGVLAPRHLSITMGAGQTRLDEVEVTVLDEADHMADLGFLPGVRRLLAATPRNGQRLFFSATLDKAVDALVKQFLTNPVTHEADSAQSPVATMTHHVLHVERDHRVAILTDLVSAPGRTVVFTRTKHGAKALAKQLNRNGIPAVELHGNLGQNARTRNLDAFHAGDATVLVATDIAARGIHVDDVTLVIHADPPAEHKAYLHRSGRTARAGNEGVVVTLMTSEQSRDVRDLTRAAGINPTTTRVNGASHPIMTEIAPGERFRAGAFVAPLMHGQIVKADGEQRSTGANAQRKRARRRSGGQGGSQGAPKQGQRQGGPKAAAPKSGAPASGSSPTQGNRTGHRPSGGQRSGGHSAANFSGGGRRGGR